MIAFHDSSFVGETEFQHRPGTDGPCVVMLHGIGSNMASFDRLTEQLPQSWGVLAWNAPGYGRSMPLEAPAPCAADYAARLATLFDDLGIRRAVLMGHSLGTLMAVAFAAAHPERVIGLVLAACAQGHGLARGVLGDKARARLDDLARLGPQAFAEARAPRLLHAPETKPALVAEATQAMAAINPAGYAQAVHMLAGGDLSGAAAAVALPSLVVVGAHDHITPPEQSRAVHRALKATAPGQRHDYLCVPEAGHLVHQEAPEAVAAQIRQFVSALAHEEETIR